MKTNELHESRNVFLELINEISSLNHKDEHNSLVDQDMWLDSHCDFATD